MYYSNNPGSFVPVNQNKQVNFPNIPLPVMLEMQNEAQAQIRKLWTSKEEKKLRQLFELYGNDWDKISEEMPGRTQKSCKSKYYHFVKPMENPSTLRKDCFTKEEDEKLKQLVEHLGENWKKIVKDMPGRAPCQCRNRWKNYLLPDLNNNPWTQEEDELLITKYQELGPKWALIAHFFENRTEVNLRNRFNCLLRKEKRRILKNQSNNAIPTSSQQISDATPIPLQQTSNVFNATPIPLQQTSNVFNATPIPLQQTSNAFNATPTFLLPQTFNATSIFSQQTPSNLPEKPKEIQENNSSNNIATTPLQQTSNAFNATPTFLLPQTFNATSIFSQQTPSNLPEEIEEKEEDDFLKILGEFSTDFDFLDLNNKQDFDSNEDSHFPSRDF